jgi:decaprenylphospho-beta-D-ribofuranose 2-oxidase
MDVHGKNAHAMGSFSDHVMSMEILSAGQLVTVTPSHGGELFRRTVGGLGASGLIYSATLQTVPAPSGCIRESHQATGSLEETLEVLLAETMTSEFSYAWVDPMAGGRRRGRGIVWSASRDLGARPPGQRPLSGPASSPGRLGLPVPRTRAWANLGLAAAITDAAWRAGSRRASHEVVVREDAFHFPFARAPKWSNVYGRQGFLERHFVLPDAVARDLISRALALREEFSQPAIFASLKRFTTRSRGVLGFVRPGVSLALQVPRSASGKGFVRALNDVVADAGGVEYLAKTQDEASLVLSNVDDANEGAAAIVADYVRVNAFLARHAK